MGLASCGSIGSLIVNSLWLIAVDPHRGGSISLLPDRQTPVFGQNLPIQRLRRITAACPRASPTTPLPQLRGASRDAHDLPERTTLGLSAVCRGGHDQDPQASRAVTTRKRTICILKGSLN